MEDRRRKTDPNGSKSPSEELLGLIADWVTLYEGNYGREPSDATLMSYRLGLGDLKPMILHDAFKTCLQHCSFFPTVAEVRSAYWVAAENRSAPHRLPEAPPTYSVEERMIWNKQMAELGKKLGIRTLSEEEIEDRRKLLRGQAEKINKKAAGQ